MANETPVNEVPSLETQEHDVEKGISKQTSHESTEKRPASTDASENTIVVGAGSPAFDPDDPTLPLNWSTSKKCFNLTVPAVLTFVV